MAKVVVKWNSLVYAGPLRVDVCSAANGANRNNQTVSFESNKQRQSDKIKIQSLYLITPNMLTLQYYVPQTYFRVQDDHVLQVLVGKC